MARPLRREDLLGVVLREGAADPRRGARALRPRGTADRGRRLGRLAAHRSRDPEHVHRRLQGDVVEARRVSRQRLLRRARPALRARRRREDVPHAPGARQPSRGADRTSGGADRPAGRDAGRSRQRRRARLGAGGDRNRARVDGRDHGDEQLPHPARRRARVRRGHVRRRRGRRRPGPDRLRGRPVRRRGHLRVVRRAGGAARVPRGGPARGRGRPRDPRAGGGEAPARRERPAGARLVERQPLGPRRCRPERPDRRDDAGHEGARRSTGRCSRQPPSARG